MREKDVIPRILVLMFQTAQKWGEHPQAPEGTGAILKQFTLEVASAIEHGTWRSWTDEDLEKAFLELAAYAELVARARGQEKREVSEQVSPRPRRQGRRIVLPPGYN